MPTLYAPGTTPIAVTPRGFAVLEPGASASLLARIRAVVTDGRGLGGVIEALTGAYGASLTAIPAFAVALVEGDGVRVAVRGDFAFEVDAATPERVSGVGVMTWTERVIPGVVRVSLTTPELDASAPAELEIADGVVLAAGIVWDAAAVRPSATAPAPDASAPAVSASGASTPVRRSAESAPVGEPDIASTPPIAVAPPGVFATVGSTTSDDPDLAAEHAEAPASTASHDPAPAVEPADAPTSAVGLIDSGAVPSAADAETLLPSDSTLLSHDGVPDRAAVESAHAGTGDVIDASAGYDQWDSTVIRPVEAAAERLDGAGAPVTSTDSPAGDHDGATISLAQARALRAASNDGSASASGFLPHAPLDPLAPPRPPAPGRLRVSTGQVIPLDRTVVIGRRPRSTRVSGTDLPHLVAVDSPQQDISRSHVELRVESESIIATDLRTTNGTTLLRPGTEPVRLHPGEGTVVIPGDVLDLGDGITVAIEGLS